MTTALTGSPETPDIVSSCDRRSEADSEETGSKRNSMELDESFGILSPGDMRDFTASSMTQSLVSVSSLPRDVSWDELNTDTTDNTVTEDYTDSLDKTSHDASDADSLPSRAKPASSHYNITRNTTDKFVTRTNTSSTSHRESNQVFHPNFTREAQNKSAASPRITRTSQAKFSAEKSYSTFKPERRAEGNKCQIVSPLSPGAKGIGRNSLQSDLFDISPHPSPLSQNKRRSHMSSMSDNDLDYLPSRGGQHRSEQRFCLDSDKLEEIEALTSGPIPHLEVPHILADVDISPPLSESLPKSETKDLDCVSQLLFERTENLLKKSPRKSKPKEHKLLKSDQIKDVLKERDSFEQIKCQSSELLETVLLNEEGRVVTVNPVNKLCDIDRGVIPTQEAWRDHSGSEKQEITEIESEIYARNENKRQNETDNSLAFTERKSYFPDHFQDTELKEKGKIW